MTEIDGVYSSDSVETNKVIVIGSTNRKESLDPAILRSGRFDLHLHFELPNQQQRFSILNKKLKKIPTKDLKEVHIETLSKMTEGYSGAQLDFLCKEAAMRSLRESDDPNNAFVTFEHLKLLL